MLDKKKSKLFNRTNTNSSSRTFSRINSGAPSVPISKGKDHSRYGQPDMFFFEQGNRNKVITMKLKGRNQYNSTVKSSKVRI